MNLTVHLGEPFWRAIGQREVALSLLPGVTVAEALAALTEQYPALSAELNNGEAQPTVFVNNQMAEAQTALCENATVHIVWPVSGG